MKHVFQTLVGNACSLLQKGQSHPIFGPYLLWPNGWMDQDVAWYGCRPRPRPHCVGWGPAFPEKRHSPNFVPCLLWPNDWMDQDATWYGGRPRPRRHCVRWGPSSPMERGTAALHFSAMFIITFRPCLSWANGRPKCQQLLSICLWSPYGIGQTIYIFMLWFVLLLLFLFPRLISAAADWMSAILPHMVWP